MAWRNRRRGQMTGYHWNQGTQKMGYKKEKRARDEKTAFHKSKYGRGLHEPRTRKPLPIKVSVSDGHHSHNLILESKDDLLQLHLLISKASYPIIAFNRGRKGKCPTCVRLHNTSCGCFSGGATLWSTKSDPLYAALKADIQEYYHDDFHLATTRYSSEDGATRYFWLVHPKRVLEFERTFDELCACPRWYGAGACSPNRGVAMFVPKKTADKIYESLPTGSNTFLIPSNYTREEILATVKKHDPTEVHSFNIGYFLRQLFGTKDTIVENYPGTKGLVLIACIERLTPLAKKLGYVNVTVNLPGGKANIVNGTLEDEYVTAKRETLEETEYITIDEKLIKRTCQSTFKAGPQTYFVCTLKDSDHLFEVADNGLGGELLFS